MIDIRPIFIAVAALLICYQAAATPAGQVDFTDLSATYGEPRVEVNLGKPMLSLLKTMSANSDPELGNLLATLEQISVKVYNLNKSSGVALEAMNTLIKSLEKLGWSVIVNVNENDQKIRIFTKLTNDVMDGLVVVVVSNGEPGEAIFINIVGQIDPAQVAKVTKSLNIDIGAPTESTPSASK